MTARQRAEAMYDELINAHCTKDERKHVFVQIAKRQIESAEERGTQSADPSQWQEENAILRRLLEAEAAKVRKLANHFHLSEMDVAADPIPDRCEWADLGELTDEVLRERLRSRAAIYECMAASIRLYQNGCLLQSDGYADLQILIDLIRQMELRVQQEVERLEQAEDHPVAEGQVVS